MGISTDHQGRKKSGIYTFQQLVWILVVVLANGPHRQSKQVPGSLRRKTHRTDLEVHNILLSFLLLFSGRTILEHRECLRESAQRFKDGSIKISLTECVFSIEKCLSKNMLWAMSSLKPILRQFQLVTVIWYQRLLLWLKSLNLLFPLQLKC